MALSNQRVEKIAALCAMIWFATIIDACYTWFLPWIVTLLIGTSCVIYATFLLKNNKELKVNGQRQRLFALFLCLFFFMLMTQSLFIYYIRYPLLYSPIFCIVLWPRNVLVKFYTYLKRFIVFYAIVSVFVEILVLSGIYVKLPCIILPPQDNVQEFYGITNRFYGFFVIPEYTDGLIFYRAMGPLREGGHFSIFLGFIYFVEKTVFDKRNAWILLTGMLTLSPNFLFFFIIAEGYIAITHKHIKKTIIGFVCFVIIVVAVIWFSPGFIKDEIIRIVFERTLEESIENAGTNGYMEILDGRVNIEGIHMWNHFVKHADIFSKLTGMGGAELEEQYVLSDFRCLIFQYGYLGFALIFICMIGISFSEKKGLFGICVLLLGIWVLISRAWMFRQLYIWTMMLLAVNSKVVQELSYRVTCSLKIDQEKDIIIQEENN